MTNERRGTQRGYTHYYKHGKIESAEWEQAMEAAARIIKYADKHIEKICGWDGTGSPLVNEERIVFNGCAELGGDCETFELKKEPGLNFCKTNRYAYDVAVVALLYWCAVTFGEERFQFTSDGSPSELADGIHLAYKSGALKVGAR